MVLAALLGPAAALAAPTGAAMPATGEGAETPSARLRLERAGAESPRPWAYEIAAGVLAGALAVPVSAAAAGAIGRGPGSLVLAALPATLLYLAAPPLAVSLAAFGVGRRFGDDATCWAKAFWWSLGAQALGFALTVLAGASLQRPGDLALVTAGSAVALAAVATFTLPHPWGRGRGRR